ncbi:MAG: energy-coupling factor transporter transmembrane protein EcfT [Clostridia bacterium]|nr:energy-coupling factor transporter transmembrane protein EcfT [Clostridia bacterium]
MRSFSQYNPVAVAVYFLAVAGIAMFCMNPVLLFISLSGAVLLCASLSGMRGAKHHLMSICLFLALALINPLVSHNGVTVLFVINDSPITAEAVLYGAATAAMVVAVLYWFRSFTAIMTSDKLLYLFGKLSPKLALILSMGLRYVPLFGRQTARIGQTQRALGLYKDDNIIDRARGGLRIFSVMVTWALENGIVTADSMAARGYGTGKRTHFSIFRFRRADIVFLTVTVALSAIVCVSIAVGSLDFTFYPSVRMADIDIMTIAGYASYTVLVLLPTIIEAEEKIKWKYLISKI